MMFEKCVKYVVSYLLVIAPEGGHLTELCTKVGDRQDNRQTSACAFLCTVVTLLQIFGPENAAEVARFFAFRFTTSRNETPR